MTTVGVEVQRHDGMVRLAVAGEIDLGNAADVQAQLTSEIGNDATDVELDLRDVVYLDSAGLRVLFALASRLRLAQTAFRVVAPAGTPARFAIEVSGMASLCGLAE